MAAVRLSVNTACSKTPFERTASRLNGASVNQNRPCTILHIHSFPHGCYALSEQEALWGRNADAKTPGSRLMALIRAAYEQAGKTVVVLVDEYDAPLLNVAHDPEKLHAFRLAMREFFAPLKACDEYLRFVFLTGITKFSQLSIFSELNNLKNISLDHRFAAICGITEEELTGQMSSDVNALAATLSIHRDEAAGPPQGKLRRVSLLQSLARHLQPVQPAQRPRLRTARRLLVRQRHAHRFGQPAPKERLGDRRPGRPGG